MSGADAVLTTAEIVAIGSELLVPPRLDTNSLTITTGLASLGIRVGAKHVVGDRVDAVARVIEDALTRADLVVLSGGLGPTDDDVTRDAVARVVGRPMHRRSRDHRPARGALRLARHPDAADQPAAGAGGRGRHRARQPEGTAPGLWVEHGRQAIVLLPGPPRELGPMLEGLLQGRLAARAPATRMHTRTILIAGARRVARRGAAAAAVSGVGRPGDPDRGDDPRVGGAARAAALRARRRGAGRGRARAAASQPSSTTLGPHVFSTDGRSIEQVVGDAAHLARLAIALAESCTGGLVTSRLTDIPGSSAYVSAPSSPTATRPRSTCSACPAASPRTAPSASSSRLRWPRASAACAGVEVGVGITGIAGPTGGSEAKPVGTVCLAVRAAGRRAAVTHEPVSWRADLREDSSPASEPSIWCGAPSRAMPRRRDRPRARGSSPARARPS